MKIEKRKCVICGEKQYGTIDIGITKTDGIYLAKIPLCKRHYELLDKIGKEEEKKRGNELVAIPYEVIKKEGIDIDEKLLANYSWYVK